MRNYPKGIVFIQLVYVVLILAGFLNIVLSLFKSDFSHLPIILPFYVLDIVIFFGITRVKSWLPLLAVVNGCLFALGFLPYILFRSTHDPKDFIAGAACLFYAYQAYVFSMQKTKEFFRDKGTTLIA